MRTEITMTPQELEDIKKEVIKKVCKCICKGNVILDINKTEYNDYAINISIGPLDEDFTYETSTIYASFNELIPALQKLILNDNIEYNQYKIESFEKN